jgi:hypothetical protein
MAWWFRCAGAAGNAHPVQTSVQTSGCLFSRSSEGSDRIVEGVYPWHDRNVYVLVTLLEGPKFGEVDVDHEPFIDSLAAEQLVLLGGDLIDAEQGVGRPTCCAATISPRRRRSSRPTRSSPAT